MDINDITKLIQTVSDYSLTRFELEDGDTKISIRKDAPKLVAVKDGEIDMGALTASLSAAAPAVSPAAAQEKEHGAASINSDRVVTSPLVGTFYSAPSPDDEPYVKEGDTVKKGQILGLVEAMKLMNEIESEYDGVIEAVLVNNEDVVEYGQPLFRIK